MSRNSFLCLAAVAAATWAVLGVASCSKGAAPTSASALMAHAPGGHADSADQPSAIPEAMLAAVRAATAKYHYVSAALDAGYQLGYRGVVTGCVANPGVGAMGYHYFNWAKMDDPSINENDPEVLVYHSTDDGDLVLGAVEWVVPKVAWEAAGNSAAPVVFGQQLHVINPVLNWYVEHAWIWTENPSGIFKDWNPSVVCP